MTLKKIEIDDDVDVSNVLLPQEYLDGLREMLKTVVKFLNDNDIEYFIDGGTLLGCVRDKGQIPWDDDIDLGMNPHNFYKLRKILKSLELLGFSVRDQPDNVIKIFHKDVAYIRNCKKQDDTYETRPRNACIDIFEYSLLKKKYILSNVRNRKLYEGAEYNKNDLYPLIEYDYHDFKVKGANNPEPYLSKYYGNWRKRCIHIYD